MSSFPRARGPNNITAIGASSRLLLNALNQYQKRNFDTVFGYPALATAEDMFAKYRRNGIAAAAVELIADDTWSRVPFMHFGEADAAHASAHIDFEPESPEPYKPYIQTWKDTVHRHQVMSQLAKLDRMLGYSRFAILVIGIDDGKKLEEPVKNGSNNGELRKITYLRAYSELSAEIVRYNKDPLSSDYGKPEMYKINTANAIDEKYTAPGKDDNTLPGGEFLVHASRVLHVSGNYSESPVFGQPRLEKILNDVYDLLKIKGGAAEMYWLAGNRGLQIDVDKELDFDSNAEKALEKEVSEYLDGLSRVLRTKGVTVNPLGAETADAKPNFEILIAAISTATRIPQRILIGAEAGQLASAQDRANFADHIETRRALFATPEVLIPLTKRLQRMGVLPKLPDEEAVPRFDWPSAFRQNPLERAQTDAQYARSAANLVKAVEANILDVVDARRILGFPPRPEDKPGNYGERADQLRRKTEAEIEEIEARTEQIKNPPAPTPEGNPNAPSNTD